MRGLVITSRPVFPVRGGDQLRIYGVAKTLKEMGVSVDCYYTYFPHKVDPVGDDTLFSIYRGFPLNSISAIANAFKNRVMGKPLQSGLYYSKDMVERVRAVEHDYDFILIHLVRMAYVGVLVDNRRKVWLDYTDAISMNYERLKSKGGRVSPMRLVYLSEVRPLAKYEVDLSGLFAINTVISEVDRSYLGGNGVQRMAVLKNGTDVLTDKNMCSSFSSSRIVFVGNMFSLQNQDACSWFSEHVMGTLGAEGFRLDIIGKIPEAFKIKIELFPFVNVVGEVDDIVEACADSFVGVCPMRFGAGLQNKILNYLSAGIPCLSTPISADPIDPDSKVIWRCYSPQEYINAVRQLKCSNQKYYQVAMRSREYCYEHYSWSSVMIKSGVIEELELVGKKLG